MAPQTKIQKQFAEIPAEDKFRSGGKLKANLPSTPKAIFRTSYYGDSFDFPYNPDNLAGSTYQTYDEMRDDDQVKAALSIKKDMVVNTGWQIVCDNEVVKKELETALKDLNKGSLCGGFYTFIKDVMSAYDYGFSMAEVLFKLEGGKYWPSYAVVKPPHSFEFDVDDFGRVTTVRQVGGKSALKFEPDYFLHYAYQQEFGNPYGKSDLRSAYTAWKIKKFFVRMYAIHAERFATPTITGKYPKTYTPSEIAEFFERIKSIQNNTALAIPEDAMIEFVQSSRDGSEIYTKGMDMFNTWIARSILVPDLLGISGGQTSSGSYSLGERQFNLFLSTIVNDRQVLEAKINERIINPVLKANYGEKIEAKFEFLPYSEEDSLEMAKVWSEAVRGNIYKASEAEVNHFRRSVGFPEGPVERPAPPPAFPGGEEEGDAPEDKEEDKPEEKQMSCGCEAHTYKRELTSYEKKFNFTETAKTLNDAEDLLVPQVKRAAKLIYNDLIQQIKDKGILRAFNPDKINALKPRFQKELNIVFKNNFKSLFKKSLKAAQLEIFPHSTKGFAMEDDFLPEEFMKVLEAESFKVVGDYSFEITKKAKNAVTQAIKQGVSESELAKILMEQANDFTDKWANTVARTKTTEIYNQARKTYWDTDPLAKQIVEAYQFSAIIDDRTSEVCQKLDGKIFDKGDYTSVITPPLHFNCRSVLVPVTKFEDYTPSKPVPPETLQEWGGGLVLPDSKKFAAMPSLFAQGRANVGENILVTAPEADTRIKVVGISVSNAIDNKAAFNINGMFDGNLEGATGRWDKTFSDGWILEAGKDLMLILSVGSGLNYTIEYVLIDNMGVRVG